MNFIIDNLIAFLTELRSASPIAQLLTLAGLPAAIMVVLGLQARVKLKQARHWIAEMAIHEDKLKFALLQLGEAKKRIGQLEDKSPENVKEEIIRDVADQNSDRAEAVASSYIEHNREALLEAFQVKASSAILSSASAPPGSVFGYETAEMWIRAAVALSPNDAELRSLLENLQEAASVGRASGLRVTLKGRVDPSVQEDWFKNKVRHLDAVKRAYTNATSRMQSSLALRIARAGLSIAAKKPYGVGTDEHFIFRINEAESLSACGRLEDAIALLIPLIHDLKGVYSENSQILINAQYGLAQALRLTGEYDKSLTILNSILNQNHFFLQIEPGTKANLLYQAAFCNSETGKFVEAAKLYGMSYRQALEVYPKVHSFVLEARLGEAASRVNFGDILGAVAIGHSCKKILEADDLIRPRLLYDCYITLIISNILLEKFDAAQRYIERMMQIEEECAKLKEIEVLYLKSLKAVCCANSQTHEASLRDVTHLADEFDRLAVPLEHGSRFWLSHLHAWSAKSGGRNFSVNYVVMMRCGCGSECAT